MNITTNPQVETKFSNYPPNIKAKLLNLRRIILETAEGIDSIQELEETLKWGEPSYLVKKGSTVRMDWKEKTPNQYAIYFKCTSKLVSTFKVVYGDTFNYEKNRAIVFKLDEEVPEEILSHCVALALTYHQVKHLPLLGA